MACAWLTRLPPELAAKARKLNEVDGFKMLTKEEREEAKRRKERKRKRRRKEKEEEKEKEKERRVASGSSSSSSSSSSASTTTVAAMREVVEKRKGGNEGRDVGVPKRPRETN
jgi:FtsZ-interacting cell division protein YlmF